MARKGMTAQVITAIIEEKIADIVTPIAEVKNETEDLELKNARLEAFAAAGIKVQEDK
jgi:hypothetical protein